jgi:hypothetical protein
MQSEEGHSLQQFCSLQALMPLAAALLKSRDLIPSAVLPAEDDEEQQEEAVWTQ